MDAAGPSEQFLNVADNCKSVISNMPSDKRRLVSCLLQAAMFADGQMTFRKPAVDVFSSYVHEANVPGDVPVSEAINIAHQFIGC